MTIAEEIRRAIQRLPDSCQAEVRDFAEFIVAKTQGRVPTYDFTAWSAFSVTAALRGMEDESPEYTEKDLKEKFH